VREIERLRSVLDQLEGDDALGNRAEILQVKMNLDELLYREEMMWLQRTRINWLKEGDRNTRYFHRKAKWRAKKNRIRKLKREDESWCTNQIEMQGMASQYFSSLFTKDPSLCPDELVDLFTPKLPRNKCRPMQTVHRRGNQQCSFPNRPFESTTPGWFPGPVLPKKKKGRRASSLMVSKKFVMVGPTLLH